jgi:hypothetical protein
VSDRQAPSWTPTTTCFFPASMESKCCDRDGGKVRPQFDFLAATCYEPHQDPWASRLRRHAYIWISRRPPFSSSRHRKIRSRHLNCKIGLFFASSGLVSPLRTRSDSARHLNKRLVVACGCTGAEGGLFRLTHLLEISSSSFTSSTPTLRNLHIPYANPSRIHRSRNLLMSNIKSLSMSMST